MVLSSCMSRPKSKQDVWDIQFCESTITVKDVAYNDVMKHIRNPQEDMIIYRNGSVYITVTE